MVFCIEILGESAFHKFLIQSGWSGRDYLFQYNRPTNSHMRAYRRIEDYQAERIDMHKATNIWPLPANLLPEAMIEPHVFIQGAQAESSGPPEARPKRRKPKAEKLAESGDLTEAGPQVALETGDKNPEPTPHPTPEENCTWP